MKNRNEIAAVEFPVNPIRIRECKCGCGYEFQPNRKDQLYILIMVRNGLLRLMWRVLQKVIQSH